MPCCETWLCLPVIALVNECRLGHHGKSSKVIVDIRNYIQVVEYGYSQTQC